MQGVSLLLRFLFSAARRAFSFRRAVLPLIRILVALKRFVCGCLGSFKLSGVSTAPSRLRVELHDTTPQQPAQRAQTMDHCIPSFLPSAYQHDEQQPEPQDMLVSPRDVVASTTTLCIPSKPFAPLWFQRYEHRRPVEKRLNKEKIKAGQINFSEDVPDHWVRVVHPEGARYYFSAHKNVFTDISLTELADLKELDAHIHFLREKESQLLPSSTFQRHPTQLVIQLINSEEWVYYFVNHDTHAVFWVEDLDLSGIISQDILGVTEDSHIIYAIEEQYWWHCEQYPTSVPLLEEHVTELWSRVAFAYMDSFTSIAPLSALSEDELAKILGLMPYLQGRIGATDGCVVWILARAMGIIARERFYHFHGQPGARLEADSSVYTQEDHMNENHPLFHFLDFLLCFALAAHVEELKSIWVDDIINFSIWKKFISRLTIDWSSYTIYSTVMLAVDVSLLAVPAVNKGDVNSQSVAIVATYISLLCAIGSLVSSILLARQVRTISSAGDAAEFMQQRTHRKGGTVILGLTFSLPYALLIWAVFFFALALIYAIFQETNPASLTVFILGTVLVASVISLLVWWGRDYRSYLNWLSVLKARFQQKIARGQESV